MSQIQIDIKREDQFFVGNPAIEVFLDDIKVGGVKSGETLPVSAEEGDHKITFRYSIRTTELNARFDKNASVSVRFNRGSGEIVCTQTGAVEILPHYDWQDQPRDENKVYPDKLKVSPAVAMILSLLLVGLGQMINGQLIKGLLIFVVAVILGVVSGGWLAPVIWILSAIDAYMCANKLKRGKPIGRFSFF